jgi:nitroreductase/NAD-dependent dihydropyrimidine dehydrogenase PreA subunit
MALFSVDEEKCSRDGICAAECPSRVIMLRSKEDYPEPTVDADRYCLACGHCVAVCPNGALSLNWLDPEGCMPVEATFSAHQVEHLLRSRRSIRTFHERPVERKKLEKLLEVACYAPSAKNQQAWNWLVVQDPSEVRRLAGMVIDWMRSVIENDKGIAEDRGYMRIVEDWDRGDERICRGAPNLIIVHADKYCPFGSEDCALALEYMEVLAPSLGLGTCWGGHLYTAINQYPVLFEALELPPDHLAFGAMMVGYPKYRYQRLPRRNAPRVKWH